MEEEHRVHDSKSTATPSLSLQSTQNVEQNPEWQVAQDAEPNFALLSEELISEIIERIKSL